MPEFADVLYRMLSNRLFAIAGVSVAFVVLTGHHSTANSSYMAISTDDAPKTVEGKPPVSVKMHRLQAGEPGKDGWYEAKSTEGHFRVSLPIPFNDFTMELPGEPKSSSYCVGSKSVEGFKFTVLETKIKKGTRKVDLKSLPEASRKKAEYKVTGEKYFQHQDYPAVEYQLSGPMSGAYVRCIQCPDRLFNLVVEYPAKSEADVKPYISGFFESLRIELKAEKKEN